MARFQVWLSKIKAMRREEWKTLFLQFDNWLSTPNTLAHPKTLRRWIVPNRVDSYFSRGILLATLASALYLFGCNSAATAEGKEYIGVWENTAVPGLLTTITQKGDQFVISRQGQSPDLATAKNGMLQMDGSKSFYTYDKATDTIRIFNPWTGKDNVYRRKQ